MNYRRLGKTGLMVSEIGFGAEWMERHSADECRAVLDRAQISAMSEPPFGNPSTMETPPETEVPIRIMNIVVQVMKQHV